MKFIFTGSDPHQPEVWLWNHEQRQEGPESLRDGEDAAHQQPCTCLCLRLRDKLETIFDSISPGPRIPPGACQPIFMFARSLQKRVLQIRWFDGLPFRISTNYMMGSFTIIGYL